MLQTLVTGDSLGSYGLAEAKALIIRHRDAVLAIAHALMIHRTLDAVMIHKIIASGPEHARRADWACVQQGGLISPQADGKADVRTGGTMWLVAIASGIGGETDIARLGSHVAV